MKLIYQAVIFSQAKDL